MYEEVADKIAADEEAFIEDESLGHLEELDELAKQRDHNADLLLTAWRALLEAEALEAKEATAPDNQPVREAGDNVVNIFK